MFHSDHKMMCYFSSRFYRLLLSMALLAFLILMFHPFLLPSSEFSFQSLLNNVSVDGFAVEIDPMRRLH